MTEIIQFPSSREQPKRDNFKFVRETFEANTESTITDEQWTFILEDYLKWWTEWEEPANSFNVEVSLEDADKLNNHVLELQNRIVRTLNLALIDLIVATNTSNNRI